MLLDIRSVSKSFPGTPAPVAVLTDLSLQLEAGETLALTGESGSGKSTLLTLVAGLDMPDRGEIRIAGTDIIPLPDKDLASLRRGRVGLVFQQFNLIPSLTCGQNLAFQARLAGRLDTKWLEEVSDRLGLTDLHDRYPEQLSGGQQQRVAIGRTLAARPDLILADEPTGNLDEDSSDAVMGLFLDLVRDSGAALLLVTHSATIASRLSRRAHLSHGRLE